MRKEILKKAEEILASEVYGEEDVPDEVVIGIMSEFPDAGEIEFLDRGRYSGSGQAGSFTADGEEFNWIVNEEEAERIAIDGVRQDLEDQPELFTQGWLMHYVSPGNFFEQAYNEWNYSYAEDIKNEGDNEFDNRLRRELFERGIITEEQIDDESLNEYDYIDEFVEAMTRDQMEEGGEGFDHYIDNFGEQEAWDLVIKNNLLDIEGAAEGAVDTDGWAHFLSHYDGNYEVTNNGVVYFKE